MELILAETNFGIGLARWHVNGNPSNPSAEGWISGPQNKGAWWTVQVERAGHQIDKRREEGSASPYL